MLGNFTFYNPTRIHFGKESLEQLQDELKLVGKNVLLVYGGGSIKKSGLYDQVVEILKAEGKTIVEDAGVMPNPTTDKLNEGVERARAGKVDFILAVGGGSVCDYAKAVSVSIHTTEDPWTKYFAEMRDVDNEIVPVGCVLTMVGTGSEMNGGSVITNPHTKEKIGHVFGPSVFPVFSILNPELTFTLPKYQMVAGTFDVMSHIMEQYFSGTDDNVSDYLSEGLLRSIIHSAPIAVANPKDYEARSNMMWDATMALNTLVGLGKNQDWMVHMMGHAVSAKTDATHGMTLAAISIPYYRHIMKDGLAKFKRFAINVWGVTPDNKTDEDIAAEGLNRMDEFMRSIGLVMNLRELGATEEMIPSIVEATFLLPNGYKQMTAADVTQVLTESLNR